MWHACTGPTGGRTAEGGGQGASGDVFLGGARAPLAPLLARPQARQLPEPLKTSEEKELQAQTRRYRVVWGSRELNCPASAQVRLRSLIVRSIC